MKGRAKTRQNRPDLWWAGVEALKGIDRVLGRQRDPPKNPAKTMACEGRRNADRTDGGGEQTLERESDGESLRAPRAAGCVKQVVSLQLCFGGTPASWARQGRPKLAQGGLKRGTG